MNKDQFLELHPKDQALYFLESDYATRMRIISEFEPEIVANLFEHFEEEEAAEIFARYDINLIVDIINEMNSDDVTRIFREVDPLTRNRYLSLLDKIHAQQIREILQYDEDTAGGIMEKSFFYIKSKHTVKRAKELLIELAPTVENISYLYILTSRFELVGVVSLKELLLGEDNLLITEVMTTDLKTVDVNADVITAASVVRDYDFVALPVINEYNQMQGLITVDDIIDVIADEARDNLEQLAGVDTDVKDTGFIGNITLRLPWLILLLFLTLFNSQVYQSLNYIIVAYPILSSFQPMVAAMSGNVGTQSLGLTIYRMSQDEEFGSVGSMIKYAFNEAKVYLAISLILSIIIFIILGFVMHQLALAETLAVTLPLTFVLSAFVGTMVPLVLDKLKFNSQVASGPLISTVNDLVAIVTYLLVGSIFM